MRYVTIPFDFEKLPPERQTRIVPICIERCDRDGSDIAWGWFEAVETVQDPLRRLAGSWLHDVWRVSELAEASVHTLWYRHRFELGRRPGSRILTQAKWYARDLQAGSWQRRRGVLEGLDGLDALFRARVLTDPSRYEHIYQREIYFKALGKQLEDSGQEDVSRMLTFVRDGRSWAEIGQLLGRDPDAARIKFRRWIRRWFP
jgi:hypothetical protein